MPARGMTAPPAFEILDDMHLSSPPRRDQPLSLEIDGLTKSYGDSKVVDDLTFTVEPGRVTGFRTADCGQAKWSWM